MPWHNFIRYKFTRPLMYKNLDGVHFQRTKKERHLVWKARAIFQHGGIHISCHFQVVRGSSRSRIKALAYFHMGPALIIQHAHFAWRNPVDEAVMKLYWAVALVSILINRFIHNQVTNLPCTEMQKSLHAPGRPLYTFIRKHPPILQPIQIERGLPAGAGCMGTPPAEASQTPVCITWKIQESNENCHARTNARALASVEEIGIPSWRANPAMPRSEDQATAKDKPNPQQRTQCQVLL